MKIIYIFIEIILYFQAFQKKSLQKLIIWKLNFPSLAIYADDFQNNSLSIYLSYFENKMGLLDIFKMCSTYLLKDTICEGIQPFNMIIGCIISPIIYLKIWGVFY